MKYPRLVKYIRGMYEESGAKEGGWSDDEVVTDLMRIDEVELVAAEQALSAYPDNIIGDLGYYDLRPAELDEFQSVLVVAEELAK